MNKCIRRVQEREVLTGLALLSRIFEIGRPVSYLVCEIGYKASAKLRLGIYYLRKSVFLIFLNNHLTDYYNDLLFEKKKQKTIFFFSKYA
jgi:hypothetical protein